MKTEIKIAVGLFVILFFAGIKCANASEAALELGAGYSSEFNGGKSLVYTERFFGKWDVGVVAITEQDYHDTDWSTGKPIKFPIVVRSNSGYFVQRIVTYKKFEMGLGIAHWFNTNRFIGCKDTWALMGGYNFTPRFGVKVRHWSNFDACDTNRGQDMATFVYRF